MPRISIKPVMSPQERQREKFVLQERRKLVQSGINKTDIRIRGDSLFVNGNKHGFATNTGFTQLSPTVMMILKKYLPTMVLLQTPVLPNYPLLMMIRTQTAGVVEMQQA